MMVSTVNRGPQNKYSRHLNFSTTSQAETQSLQIALATLRLSGGGNAGSKPSGNGPHMGGVKTN